jgi:hypothetical protein
MAGSVGREIEQSNDRCHAHDSDFARRRSTSSLITG